MIRPPESVVRAFLTRFGVVCAQCRKRVDSIEVADEVRVADEVTVFFYCHGKLDTRRLVVRPYAYDKIDWPRKVFLRNWASTGPMSAEARRERRAWVEGPR
jgi:hypothetical protein